MDLIAFHGKQKIKDFYLERVKRHMELDELVRGTGYEPTSNGNKGKMCAIGCTLEAYDHTRYPVELGIPEWLARLEDTLFEGMSLEKSKTWPKDFLEAIMPGTDLEKINGPFLIIVLSSTLETFNHEKFPDVKTAIENSIALWRRLDIGSKEWESAARSAARSVWSAKFNYFADELLKLLSEARP